MDLGVAFQLVDDALDYVADQNESGKLLGRDLEEGKMTLPLIHALRRCLTEEREQVSVIFSKEHLHADDLGFVQNLITRYDGIDYTRQRASYYVKQAIARLAAFPDSLARQALVELAESATHRRY
jgi:octaprenyl-diphosphate synthase